MATGAPRLLSQLVADAAGLLAPKRARDDGATSADGVVEHLPQAATPPDAIARAWRRTDKTLELALALIEHAPALRSWSPASRLRRVLTSGSERGT